MLLLFQHSRSDLSCLVIYYARFKIFIVILILRARSLGAGTFRRGFVIAMLAVCILQVVPSGVVSFIALVRIQGEEYLTLS